MTESDGPIGTEDLFEATAEMIRQEEKALKEAGSWKATIQRDEVSISKVGRGKAEGSSTTERSKERLYELNREEENKMHYHMIRKLKQMLKEQKEYSATLREKNCQQTSGQGQVSETNDV